MKSKNILKNKKGETLIESVIAMAIFAILAASLASLLINAANINKNAIKLNRANTIVTEGIDGDSGGIDPTLPVSPTNPKKAESTDILTNQEIKLVLDGDEKVKINGTISETKDQVALDGNVKNTMHTFRPGA